MIAYGFYQFWYKRVELIYMLGNFRTQTLSENFSLNTANFFNVRSCNLESYCFSRVLSLLYILKPYRIHYTPSYKSMYLKVGQNIRNYVFASPTYPSIFSIIHPSRRPPVRIDVRSGTKLEQIFFSCIVTFLNLFL